MPTTLPASAIQAVTSQLHEAELALARRYPGASGERQPVHSFYGGAHLFRAESVPKLGAVALRTLGEQAPDPNRLAEIFGLPLEHAATVYERIADKLRREPIEDYRIDFEDGYGNRSDEEEDGHAVSAAGEVALALERGTLPPFFGLRIKALTEETRDRAIRTLDLFLTTLAERTGGRVPQGFLVTLPKVVLPDQVRALAGLCAELERGLSLPDRTLRLEVMVETPQAVLDPDGRIPLPRLVAAGEGRCVAAHLGAYDYTAACDVTAGHQSLTHPACDFARDAMQVSLAGTGIWLADGATTTLPIAPHRSTPEGPPLTPGQEGENREVIQRAWKLHYGHVRRALARGFYQSWDLHPAQLVSRYAAVYSFFLEEVEMATGRLRNFLEKAARATRVGEVFDDAATGQGLLNSFRRAVNCGALPEAEALERTGLTLDELRGRSFPQILKNRRA